MRRPSCRPTSRTSAASTSAGRHRRPPRAEAPAARPPPAMSASRSPQPADDGHTGEVLAPSGPPDLVHGAFSDEPPWLVDPAAMSWRRRGPAPQSGDRESDVEGERGELGGG